MTESLPSRGEPRVRIVAAPAQNNPGGTIFGGWLMAQMDVAASIPALARAHGPVVTAAVEKLHFLKPLAAGDLVSIYAEVVEEGRSAMQIQVDVYAERVSRRETPRHVASGRMVFVAVNESGRPRALPADERKREDL